MGYWGVKSYEIDEADEALDRAFERVHGPIYEELMDDRNPLTAEQIQQKLADPATLEAAVAALIEEFGAEFAKWDEVGRLAYVGVLVRHAELNVAIPVDWRNRAIEWLGGEEIEWEEPTLRRLRREKEIALLSRT